MVSQLGVDAGALIGGAVVTEKVFGLQGTGQPVVQSIVVGDAPVVPGVVLLTAACVVIAGLLVDLADIVPPRHSGLTAGGAVG